MLLGNAAKEIAARIAHFVNDIFVLIMDSINEMLIKARRLAFKVLGAPSRSIRHHSAILEQVGRGDAERARQAMRNHLTEGEQTQSKALRAKKRKPRITINS